MKLNEIVDNSKEFERFLELTILAAEQDEFELSRAMMHPDDGEEALAYLYQKAREVGAPEHMITKLAHEAMNKVSYSDIGAITNENYVSFKWYVGVKSSTLEPFRFAGNQAELPERFPEYDRFIGPFNTQRGAHYWAKFTKGHPNMDWLSVKEAERLAKEYVDGIKYKP